MSKVIPFCMCEGLCEKNVQYEKVRRPVPYPQRVEEVGVGKVYLVSLQSILFGMRKLYPFVCRKLLSFHVKNYTFLYVVFLVCVFMLSLRQTYKHIFLSLVSCQQKKDPIPPPLAIRSTSVQTNISILAQGSSSCTFWRCRS